MDDRTRHLVAAFHRRAQHAPTFDAFMASLDSDLRGALAHDVVDQSELVDRLRRENALWREYESSRQEAHASLGYIRDDAVERFHAARRALIALGALEGP